MIIENEISLKMHLIVTDIHEEYEIKWCGSLIDTKPLLKDGLPVFIIIGSVGRVELNTIDIKAIERCAKRLTYPRGRQAITTDKSRIYLKQEDGSEKLLGIVTHNHIKTYAPMFDKVGIR